MEVTLRLNARRSLAAISLDEVAQAAGIVPTAFYRYYESMDALGVDLVDECMRPLRALIRDARRGSASNGDKVRATVQILGRQVRENPDQFRFLSRERYGAVRSVRRAVEIELVLFTQELAADLGRLTTGWSAADLEMAADLMIAAMLGAVRHLVDASGRHTGDERAVLDRAERQLRLIVLGMGRWRT